MLQNKDQVRWLLVGTGDIAAKRVAPALTTAPGGSLVAVCSRDVTRAKDFAVRFNAPLAFDNIELAIQSPDVDAVYLATPVDCHVRDTQLAAAHGKHVLVEKPLGLSAADAQVAADTVRKAGVLGACAYYRRCSARFLHAAEMIRSGRLGRIVLVRMTYHAWFNPTVTDPKWWRVQPASSGGGVLADMGCHMLDLLIGLLGVPVWVSAKSRNLVHGYPAEDNASFVMEMPDGAQVVGSFGWSSKSWRHELEVVGTEGHLKWAPFDTGPVELTVGRSSEQIELPAATNVHEPLISDFHLALQKKKNVACTMQEAVLTNQLLDAIYVSSASGTPQRLKRGAT